jgi:hypothetical protein
VRIKEVYKKQVILVLFASGYGLLLRYMQAKSKDDYNLDEKFVSLQINS